MVQPSLVSEDSVFLDICKRLHEIQATESVANTGAGKRQDGAVFEHLMVEYWDRLAQICVFHGASVAYTADNATAKKKYAVLSRGNRNLVLPCSDSKPVTKFGIHRNSLRLRFKAKDILAQYPSLESTIRSWAPEQGKFSGVDYRKQYEEKVTEFDDTIIKLEDGMLVEKVLLEYKTSKSSKGKSIDGNAHERLSFQMLQYAEIAPMFTSCSLLVFSNGAFGQYENKYHMFFRLQMERLKVLSGFKATFNSDIGEYVSRAQELHDWLEG
jgi:hypothetical protein